MQGIHLLPRHRHQPFCSRIDISPMHIRRIQHDFHQNPVSHLVIQSMRWEWKELQNRWSYAMSQQGVAKSIYKTVSNINRFQEARTRRYTALVAVTVYLISGKIVSQISCSFSQAKAAGMSQGLGCDAANCMYVDTKVRRHVLWLVPSGRSTLLTFFSHSGWVDVGSGWVDAGLAWVAAGLEGDSLTIPYFFFKKKTVNGGGWVKKITSYSAWNTSFSFRWAPKSSLSLNSLIIVFKPKFNDFDRCVVRLSFDFDLDILGDLDVFW